MRSLSFFVAILLAVVGTNALNMEKTHNKQKFLRVDTTKPDRTKYSISGVVEVSGAWGLASLVLKILVELETMTGNANEQDNTVRMKGIFTAKFSAKPPGLDPWDAGLSGSVEIILPLSPDVGTCPFNLAWYVIAYVDEWQLGHARAGLATWGNPALTPKGYVDTLPAANCQALELRGALTAEVNLAGMLKVAASAIKPAKGTKTAAQCQIKKEPWQGGIVATFIPNSKFSFEYTAEVELPARALKKSELKISARFPLKDEQKDKPKPRDADKVKSWAKVLPEQMFKLAKAMGQCHASQLETVSGMFVSLHLGQTENKWLAELATKFNDKGTTSTTEQQLSDVKVSTEFKKAVGIDIIYSQATPTAAALAGAGPKLQVDLVSVASFAWSCDNTHIKFAGEVGAETATMFEIL